MEQDLQELIAAYHKMDDRARQQQLRKFKRAALDYPRPEAQAQPALATVVPLRRIATR